MKRMSVPRTIKR